MSRISRLLNMKANFSFGNKGRNTVKTVLGTISCTLLSAIACCAQTPQVAGGPASLEGAPSTIRQFSSIAPEKNDSPPGSKADTNKMNLPDAPRAKVTKEYNFETGPLHMGEPDRTLGQAFRNPIVSTASALLAAATAIQIIKTNRCIDEGKAVCNLITGRNRAATYAFNIPLTAGIIFSAVKLKQKGKANANLTLLTLAGIYEAILTPTANGHVLVCKPDRTPQCQ
jgi:hypothetical protein